MWIGIAVAIVCGVLSNLGTPLVTRGFSRVVVFFRLRSLRDLEADLTNVRHLRQNHDDRILYFWKQVFLILSALAAGLLVQRWSMLAGFSAAFLSWSCGRAYFTKELIVALRRGDAFESEAVEQIKKLRQKTLASEPEIQG
jgi:hypothetical protein